MGVVRFSFICGDIENEGIYDSAETVQVYVKAPGSLVPNPQLKALYKIKLKAKETMHIECTIPKEACELLRLNTSYLKSELPASTTTALATMIRNSTSYTMSTGV